MVKILANDFPFNCVCVLTLATAGLATIAYTVPHSMEESNKSSVNPDRKLSVLYSFQKVYRLIKANSMSHSFLWTHRKLIELCDITHDKFFVHNFYNMDGVYIWDWYCYFSTASVALCTIYLLDVEHSQRLICIYVSCITSAHVYSHRGKHRASTYNVHVINK